MTNASDDGTSDVPTAGSTRQIRVGKDQATELSVSGLTVTVADGPDRGRSARLNGLSLRIGSDKACDLVLTDPTVSRRHATLTVRPDGVLVEDLQSTNGTWLDGARIGTGYVREGSTLKVGQTRIDVRLTTDRFIVRVSAGDESEFQGLVGRSRAMREVFALIRQVAPTDLPVAISGETGTGKEGVARAIHALSLRAKQRLLVLDCGAIVPELVRSELFGHEKGAFTGASEMRRGVFEEAAGGTVFLDELGEIQLAVQPNLLRVLESREVQRLGSASAVPVDFRLVSATNRDLRQSVQKGTFRADLFYRVTCVTIHLPPLRERLEDLPLLARHFLRGYAARNKVPVPQMDAEVERILEAHAWPGNLRELRNVMETASVLSGPGPVSPAAVKRVMGEMTHPAAASTPAAPARVGVDSLAEAERVVIEQALRETGWNRKAAARKLGISHTTIFDKIRRYGLKPPGEGAA